MADSPKTLADVKALLEQAVQAVDSLQAPDQDNANEETDNTVTPEADTPVPTA